MPALIDPPKMAENMYLPLKPPRCYTLHVEVVKQRVSKPFETQFNLRS